MVKIPQPVLKEPRPPSYGGNCKNPYSVHVLSIIVIGSEHHNEIYMCRRHHHHQFIHCQYNWRSYSHILWARRGRTAVLSSRLRCRSLASSARGAFALQERGPFTLRGRGGPRGPRCSTVSVSGCHSLRPRILSSAQETSHVFLPPLACCSACSLSRSADPAAAETCQISGWIPRMIPTSFFG